MTTSKTFRYLLILLAIIFWGTSFVATKTVLQEIKPVTIIILRLVLASVLLTIIALSTKRKFSINLKSHGWIFILALVAVFHLWIQVTGLQYTTAANTGWIIGTAPVFMAILGFTFYKEKITLLQFAGILVALAGLLLLIGKGDITNIGLIENKGDLLVLGSAFTWGVYGGGERRRLAPLIGALILLLGGLFAWVFANRMVPAVTQPAEKLVPLGIATQGRYYDLGPVWEHAVEQPVLLPPGRLIGFRVWIASSSYLPQFGTVIKASLSRLSAAADVEGWPLKPQSFGDSDRSAAGPS